MKRESPFLIDGSSLDTTLGNKLGDALRTEVGTIEDFTEGKNDKTSEGETLFINDGEELNKTLGNTLN